MSKQQPHQESLAAEADIVALLQAADARPEPPTDMRTRVFAATREAYDALPQTPPETAGSWHWPALAAAAVLAVLAGLSVLTMSPSIVPMVATVEYATGAYTLRSEVDQGSTLAADSLVATAADARMLLALSGGARVRLDHDTRVTVQSGSHLQLHTGRIYVDAAADRQGTVTVLADGAAITDIGTLFSVTLKDQQLSVATREGIVAVQTNEQRHESRAENGQGERLRFEGQLLTSRGPLEFDDPSWQWTRDAVPAFNLQGASYHAYLAWAARETGRELRYAAPSVALYAQQQDFGNARGTRDANLASVEDTLRTADLRLSASEPHALLVDFQR